MAVDSVSNVRIQCDYLNQANDNQLPHLAVTIANLWPCVWFQLWPLVAASPRGVATEGSTC